MAGDEDFWRLVYDDDSLMQWISGHVDPKEALKKHSVRTVVDSEALAGYRAVCEEERTFYQRRSERLQARALFTEQLASVARWKVRSTHPDWFNEHGDKRGVFRKAIDAAVKQAFTTLWHDLAPGDRSAPLFVKLSEGLPTLSPEEIQEQERQELEKALEMDGDSERAAKIRDLWAAWIALPVGSPEESEAWLAYRLETYRLTEPVICTRCGKVERVLQDMMSASVVFKSAPYMCADCEDAVRREKLAAGRRERRAAQRRTEFWLHQQQLKEDSGS